MARLPRLSLGAFLSFSLAALMPIAPTAAASWVVPLASSNGSEARAAGPPPTPQGVTAACVTLQPRITIAWSAAAGATSYVVLESTTSASGPFSVVGTAAGTQLTTSALAVGNYWFAVESQLGADWVSAASSSTSESTIALSLLCVQP